MNTVTNRAADNIRILAASMVEKQNQATRAELWAEQTMLTFYMLNF